MGWAKADKKFHFRGTPHPQNVRRRIKQLKDYISVTSDWISYALIDDITDAFGPLIQSIEYEVDSIDELVLILKDAEQSDMLRRCVLVFSSSYRLASVFSL
jgi:magnesium transporter